VTLQPDPKAIKSPRFGDVESITLAVSGHDPRPRVAGEADAKVSVEVLVGDLIVGRFGSEAAEAGAGCGDRSTR